MGIFNCNALELRKDGSLAPDDNQDSDSSVILVDTKDEIHSREKVDAITYEKIEFLSNQLKGQRKLTFLFVCLIIVFQCTLVVFTAQNPSHDESKNKNFASMGLNVKEFQENLNSFESIKTVKEHIFCTTCDSIYGIGQQFFETVSKNRCCLKDISNLLQLMRSTNVKSLNEYSTKLNVLKSSITDVREDTDILAKELFNTDKNNDTDIAKEVPPNERIMWSMMKKNNRLLNLVLNRKRSVLYLIGTALEDGIYWSVEVASGDLSFEGNNILVKSGGQYMIDSTIHFSKKVCDGTENLGYVINQEYQPGEKLPIARARTQCLAGRSIDEDLRLETVLQVGLWQRLKLHLHYDKQMQSLISKTYRSHHIIIYEL